MPGTCCVPKCSKKNGHNFPRDDTLRKAWIIAIKRDKWTPKDRSIVCRDHFLDENYTKETYHGKCVYHCMLNWSSGEGIVDNIEEREEENRLVVHITELSYTVWRRLLTIAIGTMCNQLAFSYYHRSFKTLTNHVNFVTNSMSLECAFVQLCNELNVDEAIWYTNTVEYLLIGLNVIYSGIKYTEKDWLRHRDITLSKCVII